LVDLYNQGIPSSFTAAAIYSDSIRKLRVKLKKRSVSGGSDAYDASFTTITSDLINLGDIQTGIDDQEWVSGVTRSSLTIEMDNSNGLFNDRTDSGSYWHDSTSVTNYYIPNSLIEIDFGFELHTGTSYYDTFYSGLLRADSMSYTKKNTFKFKVSNKLEWLKSVNLYDTFTFSRSTAFSAIGMVDNVYKYLSSNSPSALSLTVISNSPRNDIFYENIERAEANAFSFVENIAKQSGSILGINRSNQVFMSHFNNSNIQTTLTSFSSDSNTTLYYAFNENTETSDIIDSSGNGNNLTLSADPSTSFPSLTEGKFGSGREFILSQLTVSARNIAFNSPPITYVSPTQNYTLEALFKFKQLNSGYTAASCFNYLNSSVATGTGFAQINLTNNLGVMSLKTGSFDANNEFSNITFGEDQWYYLAMVNDGDSGSANTYFNGVKISSSTASPTVTSFFLTLGPNVDPAGSSANIEFDSLKISEVALTQSQVNDNLALIYGNQLEINASTPSSYDFYNTGPNTNIINIKNYDNGYNKVFNRVINKNQKIDEYLCEFFCNANSTTVSIRQGSHVLSTVVADNDELKGAINDNFSNLIATITGSDLHKFEVTGTGFTAYDGMSSNIFFLDDVATISSFSVTGSATFTSILGQYQFVRKDKQSEYIVQNTASAEEYGVRTFEIKPNENLTNDLSQTTVLANAILDDRKDPKIRMKLSTRFLEGNLDILNKITVNWSPDLNDLSQTAGGITWTSKDFWIIGYEHSWKNNSSNYTLREI
jgi:hypothetical protein